MNPQCLIKREEQAYSILAKTFTDEKTILLSVYRVTSGVFMPFCVFFVVFSAEWIGGVSLGACFRVFMLSYAKLASCFKPVIATLVSQKKERYTL